MQFVRSTSKGQSKAWIVRSIETPKVLKLQHDEGLIIISELQPRLHKPVTTKVQKMIRPTASAPNWPKEWVNVVTSSKPPPKNIPERVTPHVEKSTVVDLTVNSSQPIFQNIAAIVATQLEAALAPLHTRLLAMEKKESGIFQDEEMAPGTVKRASSVGGSPQRKSIRIQGASRS